MSLFKGPPIGHHIMPFGLRSGPLQNGQRGHSINIFCIVCLTLGFLACHVRASKEKPLDLESKSCLLTNKFFTSRRLSHRLVSVKNKKKVTFAFWFIVASLFALLWIQILLASLACNFYLQFLLANFTCKFYLQIYLQIFVFQDFEKKSKNFGNT